VLGAGRRRGRGDIQLLRKERGGDIGAQIPSCNGGEEVWGGGGRAEFIGDY